MSTGASQRSTSAMLIPLRPRIILDLIALDLRHAEIMRLRMREIKPRNRRARPHRVTLRQLHAGAFLRVEQAEQRRLFRVIGLCGITRRGTDAAIIFGDALLVRQLLVGGVGPELAAHALMHALGERFG